MLNYGDDDGHQNDHEESCIEDVAGYEDDEGGQGKGRRKSSDDIKYPIVLKADLYILPATIVPKLNDFLCVCFLTRNTLQLVQRAELDEEEERLVMSSVKPDDAGKPDYDQIVESRYVYSMTMTFHHPPNTGVYACVGENSEGSSRQEVLLTVFCEFVMFVMVMMAMITVFCELTLYDVAADHYDDDDNDDVKPTRGFAHSFL